MDLILLWRICQFDRYRNTFQPKISHHTHANGDTNKKTGFPLGLENLENGKAFSSQGIFNRVEKSGKNHTKYWNTEGFRQMLFVIAK